MSTSITTDVYTLIRDHEYLRAISLLEEKLGEFPRSRPLLSLLAYCCYHNQDYARSSEFYETLTELCPESEEYQVYYVQSLVKSASHLDASRVAASSTTLSSSSNLHRMELLQANAELEQGLLSECSATLSSCIEDDVETIIGLGIVSFRSGSHTKAMDLFKIARQVMGDERMLTYYIALCQYELGNFEEALNLVNEIVQDKDVEDMQFEEQPSNQNASTFIVEALNLKAAVLHASKRYDEAKATLKHFSEGLDACTIHNDVVANISEDPAIGMQKLEFLLSNQSFPPEALSNLLTLYTRHGQDDLAAETFETNKHIAQELLPSDVYAYFDAFVMSLSCPEDAGSILEDRLAIHTSTLKSVKKDLQEITKTISNRPATTASHRPTNAATRPTTAAERKEQRVVSDASKETEVVMDRFIPLVMLQCKLYWDKKEYLKAEQLLRQNADFCNNSDAWLMNMGHILFAQQNEKFEASIKYYENLLKDEPEGKLLKIPAVALANLCAAYVMTNQNEEAEELIKAVEKEEHRNASLEIIIIEQQCNTSCIINIVIGTLYCERGNFAFGIQRICKSLEPFEENICVDTWFYTKRCFLALASKISKMMCVINDEVLQDILGFFGEVESLARSDAIQEPEEQATIASEAKQLKSMFVTLCA